MSALQGVIFAVLLVMAFEWLVWLRKLSSWLRERHPEKYDEMGLDDLWPRDLAGWFRGFDNLRPSMAVLRFLTRREDRELRDPDVSRLAFFMRWLLYAYILLFSALFFSVLRQGPEVPAVPGEVASTASSASVERRDQAFDLYRAKKWPQAIAALDALIGESDRDAELRGDQQPQSASVPAPSTPNRESRGPCCHSAYPTASCRAPSEARHITSTMSGSSA